MTLFQPRAHEHGGRYGQATIVRTYKMNADIEIGVELTANHQGYFEFRLCEHNLAKTPETDECFDRHVLRRADADAGDALSHRYCNIRHRISHDRDRESETISPSILYFISYYLSHALRSLYRQSSSFFIFQNCLVICIISCMISLFGAEGWNCFRYVIEMSCFVFVITRIDRGLFSSLSNSRKERTFSLKTSFSSELLSSF